MCPWNKLKGLVTNLVLYVALETLELQLYMQSLLAILNQTHLFYLLAPLLRFIS